METLLAEMDRLIAEIADVARDYQRMAAETAEELSNVSYLANVPLQPSSEYVRAHKRYRPLPL